MKKLLLCSGSTEGPYGNNGWFRVDSSAAVRPDLMATIPPIPDELRNMGPWDTIALIHGIEHFYVWEAHDLLRQCWELLTPGGQLILEQPNLETCARYYDSPTAMMGIYGDQSWKEPALAHRYGWTPQSLTNACRKVGFQETVIETAQFHRPERDFRLVATR